MSLQTMFQSLESYRVQVSEHPANVHPPKTSHRISPWARTPSSISTWQSPRAWLRVCTESPALSSASTSSFPEQHCLERRLQSMAEIQGNKWINSLLHPPPPPRHTLCFGDEFWWSSGWNNTNLLLVMSSGWNNTTLAGCQHWLEAGAIAELGICGGKLVDERQGCQLWLHPILHQPNVMLEIPGDPV